MNSQPTDAVMKAAEAYFEERQLMGLARKAGKPLPQNDPHAPPSKAALAAATAICGALNSK